MGVYHFDTLLRYSENNPNDNNVNYVSGILCHKMKFPLDAYLYLEKYAENTQDKKLKRESLNILDSLNIEKSNIRYCKFIKEYLSKAKNGNPDLSDYWDKETINKFGKDCDIYLSQYKSGYFNRFLPLGNIIQKNGYKRLNVGYYGYSIIEEKDTLKLIHPITILTKNWIKKETDHFIFYGVNNEYFPLDETIQDMEKLYDEIKITLKKEDSNKIHFYYCPSNDFCGDMFSYYPSDSYVYHKFNIVATTVYNDYRFIILIFNSKTKLLPFLDEGLKYYFGGDFFFKRDMPASWAKDLAMIKKIPRISEIYSLKYFDYINRDNSYTAGAFIKYLLDKYGNEKLIELCKTTTEPEYFFVNISKIYNKEIRELEYDFTDWLNKTNFPTISAAFNPNAKVIFNMSDPENDDNGDGNYVYPKDTNCIPRIFDLTNFRVLKDTENVYFELKFRNLVDCDSTKWGFYRNYVEIGINTDTLKIDIGSPNQGKVWAIGKSHYVINVSPMGIFLHKLKYKYELLKYYRPDEKKFGDTINKCIRFAISGKLLNTLDENSGYIVGIGASDISKDFKLSPYLPIDKMAIIDSIASKNNGGGAKSSAYSPNYYDILLPAGYDQKNILSNYSSEYQSYACIPRIYSWGTLFKDSSRYILREQKNEMEKIKHVTSNWYITDTLHYIFHYEKENERPDNSVIELLEKSYIDLSKKYNLYNLGKVELYLLSADRFREVYGPNYPGGKAYSYFNSFTAMNWHLPHEVVHLFDLKEKYTYIRIISEGIAVALDAKYSNNRNELLHRYRESLNLNEMQNISDIYLNIEYDRRSYLGYDDYTLWGAFITYLIENYGFDKFLELKSKTTADSVLPKTINEVYKKDFPTINKYFKKWIYELKLPDITPDFNENAEEIFSMDDPENDDSGNGRYTYPIDTLCKPGIFDLTKFRVLKDKKNVYFELKFRNLVDYDSVDWGFNRNFITINIKTDSQKTNEYYLSTCHTNLESTPNYSFTINPYGIQFDTDKYQWNKIIKIFNPEKRKFGDSTKKSIRFSIPIDLVSKIDKNSGYIVGVGASKIPKNYKKNIMVLNMIFRRSIQLLL